VAAPNVALRGADSIFKDPIQTERKFTASSTASEEEDMI
jgi:hypothetical protein